MYVHFTMRGLREEKNINPEDKLNAANHMVEATMRNLLNVVKAIGKGPPARDDGNGDLVSPRLSQISCSLYF
jgi:hypothetical protein